MLVFAGISPHPPLLIPEIGKENLKFVNKTTGALKKLAEELYSTHPETIVIISPHGPMMADAFVFNLSPKFKSSSAVLFFEI